MVNLSRTDSVRRSRKRSELVGGTQAKLRQESTVCAVAADLVLHVAGMSFYVVCCEPLGCKLFKDVFVHSSHEIVKF